MRHRYAWFLSMLLLSASANAATIGPIFTSTPIAATQTDWSRTLNFPQFNPNLGTLNSVTLRFSGSLSSSITVTKVTGSTASGNLLVDVGYSIQNSGSNLVYPGLYIPHTLIGFNIGAGETQTTKTAMGSNTKFDSYTSLPVLTAFTGSGDITLSAAAEFHVLVAPTIPGGMVTTSNVTSASLTGSVTYDYTVPEPTAWVLGLLAGLGAVGARLRVGNFGFRNL